MSAQGIPVELTRITKDAGPVTKRIHLIPDGSIGNRDAPSARGTWNASTCPTGAPLPN